MNTSFDPGNCGGCGVVCPVGELCSAGACGSVCLGGTVLCDGRCVDIHSDVTACGACGTSCHVGEYCDNGSCTPTCPAPFEVCSGACTDTSLDAAHCGSCDVACKTGEVCSAGQCGLSCVGGTVRCGDRCVTTASDSENCGACGMKCSATQYCSGGECADCPPGQTKCGDTCVDLQTSLSSCGTCGNACPYSYGNGTVSCTAGECVGTCYDGYTTCPGGYVCGTSLLADQNNCGACGTTCAADEVCSHGYCSACAAGTGTCGYNNCVDFQTDSNNCGTCGNNCFLYNTPPSGLPGCIAGLCQMSSCYTGYKDCNGEFADGCEVSLLSDSKNCGACGAACAAGEVCSQGICAKCAPGLTICGGSCVDLQTSLGNCGGCGQACPVNLPYLANGYGSCVAGACAMNCMSSWFDCNGTASDGCETPQSRDNCGTCGTVCGAEQLCKGGACAACSPTDLGSTLPVSVSGITATDISPVKMRCGSQAGGNAFLSFTAPTTRSYTFSATSAAGSMSIEGRRNSCDGAVINCTSSYTTSSLTLALTAGQKIVLVLQSDGGGYSFNLTAK